MVLYIVDTSRLPMELNKVYFITDVSYIIPCFLLLLMVQEVFIKYLCAKV